MAGGGGIVTVSWYATVFRGDRLEAALMEIAPLALRFGASEYEVYRFQDDRYRFFHASAFASPLDWERYWYGEDFVAWRSQYTGWYQVPVTYAWATVVGKGMLDPEPSGHWATGSPG